MSTNNKKNVYILPTDKQSRLLLNKINNEYLIIMDSSDFRLKNILPSSKYYNLYITSDETIKPGDWGISKLNVVVKFGKKFDKSLYKKIILTTDQELIKDDVQSIDNDFIEWFMKNTSCERVEVSYEPNENGMFNYVIWGMYYKED